MAVGGFEHKPKWLLLKYIQLGENRYVCFGVVVQFFV